MIDDEAKLEAKLEAKRVPPPLERDFSEYPLPDPGVAGEWEEYTRKNDEGEEVIAGMRYRALAPNKFLVHEGVARVLLPVEMAHKHPENPRRGDVPMIRGSLRFHGQFDEVIINRGSYSVRYEPWTIAAGNHTFSAIEEEGWTHFGAQIIDVDDDEHDRITLMHNAASDSAYYDESSLVSVTSRLPSLEGTGIDAAWLKSVRDKQEKGEREPPEEFASYDDDDELEHRCPKCGYEW